MDKTNLVTVKNSKHVKGIFATNNFSKGDILLKITGKPLNFHETLDLGEEECYCLQVDKNNYIIPDAPFHLSNHSCMPNCGIDENMYLIALREIGKSEELFWDYSTSMLERHWVMNCKCGSINCRNIIKDFDLLPLLLQKEYIDIGIVMPYILKVLYSEAVET